MGIVDIVADNSEDVGFDDEEDREMKCRRVNDEQQEVEEKEEEAAVDEHDSNHSSPALDDYEQDATDLAETVADEASSDGIDDDYLVGTDYHQEEEVVVQEEADLEEDTVADPVDYDVPIQTLLRMMRTHDNLLSYVNSIHL